jgi:hypothetical protein
MPDMTLYFSHNLEAGTAGLCLPRIFYILLPDFILTLSYRIFVC